MPLTSDLNHSASIGAGIRSPTGVAELTIDIDVDAFMHDDVEDETLDLQIPEGDGLYEGLEPFQSTLNDSTRYEQFLDDDKSIVTPDDGLKGDDFDTQSSIGESTDDDDETSSIFHPLAHDFSEFVLLPPSGKPKMRQNSAIFDDHLKLLQMPIEEEDDKYVSANLFPPAAEEGFSTMPVMG